MTMRLFRPSHTPRTGRPVSFNRMASDDAIDAVRAVAVETLRIVQEETEPVAATPENSSTVSDIQRHGLAAITLLIVALLAASEMAAAWDAGSLYGFLGGLLAFVIYREERTGRPSA